MKSVMLFGTFDIIHAGHMDVFRQARKLGDKLIVVVARDETVKKIKGHFPLHSERERRYLLQHIDLIDTVLLGDKTDMGAAIRRHKPDIVALGYDQTMFVDKIGAVHVVRLKPFRPGKYKSTKAKKYLLRYD